MNKNDTPRSGHVNAVLYLLLGVLLAFFIYQDINWVVKYRFDQALDIDESGYLALAVAFAKAKANAGWAGWWHAISAPVGFAPLAPLATSLLMIVFGINENLGFICNIGFAAGTLILAFVAVRRYSLVHSLLAVLLLAAMPNFVMFSRSFQFVSATTFFFFAAFVFFVLSDGLTRRWYSVLMGVSLAAMILSRTMALAFLPAFVFAFLVYLFWVRGFSRDAVKNIAASIVAFLVVALPWYLVNYKTVFGYLFSFGYGAHAAEYGHSHGLLTLDNLMLRIGVIASQMRPGLFILLAPALIAIFVFILFARKRGTRDGVVLCGAVVVLTSFFILSTSQNMGTGFDTPIYPIIIFCVTVWLAGVRFRWMQIPFFAFSVALFSMASYAHQDLYRCMKMPKEFVESFAGYPPLVNCVSNIQGYLRTNEFPPQNQPNFVLSHDEAVAWRNLNRTVASALVKDDANRSYVLLISRHMLVNSNSVGLEMIKHDGVILPMVQIDPAVIEPSVESYSRWLEQPPQALACFALTLDDQHGEFFPRADLTKMALAMARAQYQRIADFPTPRTGQHVVLWRKKVPSC